VAKPSGKYSDLVIENEHVQAFIPNPLPPKIRMKGDLAKLHEETLADLSRLELAGSMIPSRNWFLYGFVRKEAVISSQIEGTQATLRDVIAFEMTQKTDKPNDVEEICNYIRAVSSARAYLKKTKKLAFSKKLICGIHKILMKGVRGSNKEPGFIRTKPVWIGSHKPSTAIFVPPPPVIVPKMISELEKWLQTEETIPPLIRAGIAHVQFETIHPFLDGNGRIGRLLITLLVEYWGLLSSPLLYLSLSFKKHRPYYYLYLTEVRTHSNWIQWITFFLDCIREAAKDGIDSAHRLFNLLDVDRKIVNNHKSATLSSVRLFESLPVHPIVTLQSTMKLLETTKPTANKAIASLCQAGVLHETTGMKRDRVYSYREYLKVLSSDTEL